MREEFIVTATYDGPIEPGLDKVIREAMEASGARWYAQGIDLTTNRRDLSFIIPEGKGRWEPPIFTAEGVSIT